MATIDQSAKAYDYVIIGAGSAGCVLANRLSADPGTRVLVLEAGAKDRSWLIHVPLGVGKVWHTPQFNWSYMSDPEPHLGGRQIFHPRGKVVGGSSSINMMAYVRGHRADYDRWRQFGLDGWSYDDVLPYFKRSETFEGPDREFHGAEGPLHTQTTKIDDPVIDAFLESAKSAGYGPTDDYNGARQEGVGRLQVSVKNGRRCSAAVAFLHPALKRPNLELQTGAHVTRILFDGRRAVGVEFAASGQVQQVRADAEVILSGGSINSPQILMLSGVGPAEHLKDVGIDPVHDLPGVGGNLQDHPSFGVDYHHARPSAFHAGLRLDRLAVNMVRAYLFRSGPASIPPSSVTAFIKTRPELELPDVQMFFRPVSVAAHEWFPVIKPPAEETFSFRVCHLRPESRGTIRLRSSNPMDPARIQNNFLSTETDREVLRASFKIVREIAAQSAFDAVRGAEFAPGEHVQTDDQIDTHIRETLGTVFHPAGTCKMGIDDQAVLDPEMRVRGLEGLRVIDASVMPDLAGGNINAVVIMIAEKASDMILGKEPLKAAA